MIRLAPILWIAMAALACASPEPLTRCDPVGNATPLCGYQNPEDLVRIPGTRSLLVSEFAGMEPDGVGVISRLDLDSNAHLRLYEAGDAGAKTAGWGDPSCPGAPEAFSPHGIDLVVRRDGALALAVVNHAGRESVEWFEVLDAESSARIEWRGCVVAPDDGWFNDVVALPDGGLLVSQMMPRREGLGQTFELVKSGIFGIESGFVFAWSADAGFERIRGTNTAFANGISLAADGRTLFVNSSIGGKVLRVDLETGERTGAAEIVAPDNSAWGEDGRLFIASLTAPFGEIQACNRIEQGACAASFAIVALDPETLETETVYESDGVTMGAGTVGLQVGSELFVGSFAGDRILRVQLASGGN